ALFEVIRGPGTAPPPSAATPNAGSLRDPVSTATGELYGFDDHADLELGGPLPLEIRRYYGSMLRDNGVFSALGDNWMHNFDIKLAVAGTTGIVTLFRGKTVKFSQSGAAWQLASKERLSYQLAASGAGFKFLDPSDNLV